MTKNEREQAIEYINDKYKEHSGYIGSAVELINPNSHTEAVIKEEVTKALRRINPVANIIDAKIQLKKTGSVKKAIAKFTSDQISGVIFVAGAIVGIRSGRAEVVALVISTNNTMQAEMDKAINIALEALDKYIITPVLETIHDFIMDTIIEPVVRQIQQWIPNPLSPSFFGYNTNNDDASFVCVCSL